MEETSAQAPMITKTSLHHNYNLLSIHQLQKFVGAKDPIKIKEFLELVNSTTTLFDKKHQEIIRYVTQLFKLDTKVSWNLTWEKVKILKMSQLDFKKKFKAKYRFAYVIYIMIREFITFSQGTIIRDQGIRFMKGKQG